MTITTSTILKMAEEDETYPAGDRDEHKIFVSRIPNQFDESVLKRLLEEKLAIDAVVDVSLLYTNNDEGRQEHIEDEGETKAQQHRGFAFVTLQNSDLQRRALQLGTVRGGVKATSSKKYTIYVRPVVREDLQESSSKQICFLWSKFRCPYGDECKFLHEGDGGCQKKNRNTKPRKKCFAFKKGKCKLGDECPHSHDFKVTPKIAPKEKRPPDEKDCINWATKGKCRKRDTCPYRHNDEALKALLAKKKRKLLEEEQTIEKKSQPLCVRVFGLNYDTTESDVRELFRNCGKITDVTFPTFDDSGRSKGYCGLVFQSPKAVAAAVELDGQELHGRWLQIQAGKMYLKQWENHHGQNRDDPASRCADTAKTADPCESSVGEFGQKVKRRKKHGYGE